MKSEIMRKLAGCKAVFTERPRRVPCTSVVDGPITGNGDLGIVYNSRDNIAEIWLSKNDFWKAAYSHGGGGGLKAIGRLQLTFDKMEGCAYYAEQRIADATLYMRLEKGGVTVEIESYVPYQHNAVVTAITARGGKVRTHAELLAVPAADATYSAGYENGRLFINKAFTDAHLLFSTAAAVRARFMDYGPARDIDDGRARYMDGGKDAVIEDGQTVTVVTAVVTNHDVRASQDAAGVLSGVPDVYGYGYTYGYNTGVSGYAGGMGGMSALPAVDMSVFQCSEYADQLLDSIAPMRVPVLRNEHNAWWKAFWQTSGIQLPGEPLIERTWYTSHYIMACCSKNAAFPPGLFANWITTDKPDWAGDYHLNYNYQAPWWGLYSSNKIEITAPYDTPLMEYIPEARKAARRKLDCDGLYMLVGIGPKGLPVAMIQDKQGNDDTSYWGQKSNASYGAVNMLMRYYSTYDEDYARRVAYPYLKETAAFWEDYLVFKDGRYFSYNDCAHENSVLGGDSLGWNVSKARDYGDDCNPVVSLGLIRMVFKGLLDICAELGLDEPRAEKWRHILAHISPFPTQMMNGKKVFRYTETGMAWYHNNDVGIQHVYPAGQVGLGSDPDLLQTGLNTLLEMSRWEDYNAFGTFFTAAARLGCDSEVILSHLNEELGKHAFANMYIYYGGGGIECCSGVPTCINEMLLQSHEGLLRLFPVWDRSRDAAFYQLRAYGAFLVSAKTEGGAVRDVRILSEKGRLCSVRNDFMGDNVKVYNITGETEAAEAKEARGAEAKKAVEFRVENGNIVFPTLPMNLYAIE